MSNMAAYDDPRKEISHPINIGQVYYDSRGDDLHKVLYLDDDIVLLRDKDGYHRIERRKDFDKYVGAGRFSLEPDQEFGYAGRFEALTDALSRYEEKDGRKHSHKAEALREVLSLLTEETPEFEEVEFEKVGGIGDKTAARLKDYGLTTVQDVRQTSDEELLKVRGIGESSLENLKEYINE